MPGFFSARPLNSTHSQRSCRSAGQKRRLAAEWLEPRNLLASVAGTVCEDTDLDGAFDIGERPLAGRAVYVDLNGNGRFDAPVEPSQITSSDGTYVLNDLPAGQADVGLVEKFGFEQTVPLKTPARIRELAVEVGHMEYSEATGKLYAAASHFVASPAETIWVIDPVAGEIVSSVVIGQPLWRIAVSDDGQYLYAGLADEPAIQRVNLATMTPDLRFTLGSGTSGAFYAFDLDVMPG